MKAGICLYLKYLSPSIICYLIILAPIASSLDKIFCIFVSLFICQLFVNCLLIYYVINTFVQIDRNNKPRTGQGSLTYGQGRYYSTRKPWGAN